MNNGFQSVYGTKINSSGNKKVDVKKEIDSIHAENEVKSEADKFWSDVLQNEYKYIYQCRYK